MQNEPLEVTLQVTTVLESLGVPCLIGGSLASTLYGMVRMAQDSDVITAMRPEHVHFFVDALKDDFYIDEEMVLDSIIHNTSFNIIHRDSMFRVDIFVPRQEPFLDSKFARSVRQTFTFEDEVSARFASPEDTILAKLSWFRQGGGVSERQWRDVLFNPVLIPGGGGGGGGGDPTTLGVNTHKVRGDKFANLTWSGANSTNVDIYRGGVLITATANDGAHTDGSLGKGGGSASYQVREAGTSNCSSVVKVNW